MRPNSLWRHRGAVRTRSRLWRLVLFLHSSLNRCPLVRRSFCGFGRSVRTNTRKYQRTKQSEQKILMRCVFRKVVRSWSLPTGLGRSLFIYHAPFSPFHLFRSRCGWLVSWSQPRGAQTTDCSIQYLCSPTTKRHSLIRAAGLHTQDYMTPEERHKRGREVQNTGEAYTCMEASSYGAVHMANEIPNTARHVGVPVTAAECLGSFGRGEVDWLRGEDPTTNTAACQVWWRTTGESALLETTTNREYCIRPWEHAGGVPGTKQKLTVLRYKLRVWWLDPFYIPVRVALLLWPATERCWNLGDPHYHGALLPQT